MLLTQHGVRFCCSGIKTASNRYVILLGNELIKPKEVMNKRITRGTTDIRKYAGTYIEMAESPVRHFVVIAARRTLFGGDEVLTAFPYLFYFSSFNGSSQIKVIYFIFYILINSNYAMTSELC